MHKDLATNDTVDGMNVLQLWVQILKRHMCGQCQAIWGMTGWSSSAIRMGRFWAYRIL